MTRTKRFYVLIATDGSPAAKAAVATAVQFPWPDGTQAVAVVAKQVRADYRRSILLAALDRTAEFVAKGAARSRPSSRTDTLPSRGIARSLIETRASPSAMHFVRRRRAAQATSPAPVSPYEAVTTTALHSLPPLRRYAWGMVASK